MRHGNTFSISKTAEELVSDAGSRTGYWVALGVTGVLVLFLLVVWSRLPKMVPLFFTEPWGEARLAPRQWLFVLPGLSILALIINIILGKFGHNSSPLLPRMLSVTTGIVALTMLLALLGIVQSLTL